jgi:hypothetical protein
MRTAEKLSVKFFDRLTAFGVLKSLKPLHVKDLALKMINEAKSSQLEKINVFSN